MSERDKAEAQPAAAAYHDPLLNDPAWQDEAQRRAEIAARIPSDADLDLISKKPWPDESQPAAASEGESLNSLEARMAADIRAIDGNHDKGAAELAEQLIARGWFPAVAEAASQRITELEDALTGIGNKFLDANSELAKLREENAALVKQWNDLDQRNEQRHREWQSRLTAAESKLEAVKGLAAKWRDWGGAYAQCANEIAALAETKP